MASWYVARRLLYYRIVSSEHVCLPEHAPAPEAIVEGMELAALGRARLFSWPRWGFRWRGGYWQAKDEGRAFPCLIAALDADGVPLVQPYRSLVYYSVRLVQMWMFGRLVLSQMEKALMQPASADAKGLIVVLNTDRSFLDPFAGPQGDWKRRGDRSLTSKRGLYPPTHR